MRYIALLSAAAIVGLDQLFKYLAIVFLSDSILTFPIIENVFHLTYIENRGAAFSMLEGKTVFLTVLTGLVIIALIYLLVADKIKSNYVIWSVALIIGGGIGNIVDRIFRGFVVDYLDFRLINFAIFNFADCCIVVGTILILIYVIFFDKGELSFLVGKKKNVPAQTGESNENESGCEEQ